VALTTAELLHTHWCHDVSNYGIIVRQLLILRISAVAVPFSSSDKIIRLVFLRHDYHKEEMPEGLGLLLRRKIDNVVKPIAQMDATVMHLKYTVEIIISVIN